MKGMKGKLLKKLKTIRTIGYLRPDRDLHVNALDGFVDTLPARSNVQVHTQLVCREEEPKNMIQNQSSMKVQEPEIIDVSELMRDLRDEEMEFGNDVDDKENIRPETKMEKENALDSKEDSENWSSLKVQNGNSELMRDLKDEEMEFGNDIDDKENIRPETKVEKESALDSKEDSENLSSLKARNGNSDAPGLPELRTGDRKNAPLSEIDVSSFRRPDLNSSGSLFDPNLLAAFEKAVTELRVLEAERRARIEESILKNIEEGPPLKARKIEENTNPLLDFEEKCPPGGSESVILYTTGLRGIRKTFEDCNSIRFLLESFRVLFYERDVSMHSEFREELWRTLGEKVVPPKLFIKGRYIGGAEVVLTLHEQGKLRPLFEGVPIDRSEGQCEGCAGIRFVVCFNCNGSSKIIPSDDGLSIKCPDCNENGLIICPICC